MTNVIILLVVGLIVGCAAGYIWKQKKKGVKCIGCPDSGSCSGSCGSCSCGCSQH
ncbi:MAG: FeoB-associated Cys-rich membrane protein [Oscillospiraceae bacterium]|nr:FeoB-associated Cys-rich membrane protein [Oscillospiraceae bacterium]